MFSHPKRYRDMQISISPQEDHYLARVTQSFVEGSGLSQQMNPAPYRAEGGDGITRDIEAEDAPPPASPPYGEGLGKDLFKGAVGDDFERALGAEVPIRLCFELGSGADVAKDRFLQQLPWEQLIYKSQKISLQSRFSITRKMSIAGRQLKPVRGRLKVLLLRAQPADLTEIDAEKETEKVVKIMKKAGAAVTVLPREIGGTIDRESYFEALQSGQHILHFMGHGSSEGLHFVDENGMSSLVSAGDLGTDFMGLEDHQRPVLAFLNACHSSALSTESAWLNGTAKQLFDAGIPVVIGMRESIGDQAAIAFSQAFYRKIARGRSLDEAVSAGRLGIHQTKGKSHQWHIPVLYSALEDSRVFRPFSWRKFAFIFLLLLMSAGLSHQLIRANRTPVVAMNPMVIEPASIKNQEIWLEDLSLRNGLGSAGFRIRSGNPETAVFQVKRTLTATDEGLRFKTDVLDADGLQVKESIVIRGPLTPDVETIGRLKAESARRLLAILAPGKKTAVTSTEVLRAYYEGMDWSRSDPSEARKHYEAALQLDPHHLPSKNNLALLLLKTGDLQKALDLMAEVVAAVPSIALLHYNQGLVLRAAGRDEAATAAFKKALELDSGYLDAHHELGKLYLERERLRPARRQFEKVLQLSPNHAPTHKNLGRLYLERELFGKAVEHLEVALAGYQKEHDADGAMHRAETALLLARAFDAKGAEEKARDLLTHIDRSLLWRFDREATALFGKYGPPETEQQAATVLNIQGDDVVFPARERLLKPGDQIEPHHAIRIPQTARVDLLCRHRHLVGLEGALDWTSDRCESFHGGLVPIELLDILLAPISVSSENGQLMASMKSRGPKNLYLLSPLGRTPEVRPNICWSVESEPTGFLISLSGDDGTFSPVHVKKDDLQHAELQDLGRSRPLMVHSWPKGFPDLKSGIHYRLTLRADSGEEGVADFCVLDPARTTRLKTHLNQLEKTGLLPLDRYKAQLYERFSCHGEALLALGEHLAVGPDASLGFAHKCLENGLYEWAEMGFRYHLSKTGDLQARVSALIGLGRLNASLHRDADAYLLAARSLLKEGDSDQLALINQWLSQEKPRAPR